MRYLVVLIVAVVGVAWFSTEATAQCVVCESCTSDAECGFNGACADFGTGSVCTTFCDSTTCPGDSRCYQAEVDGGGTVNICLNPDAGTSLCPSSYFCSSSRTCSGLGNVCPDACTGETELCLSDGADVNFCSCYCNSDADCGGGNSCVGLSDGRTACAPGVISNPCDGVTCPAGQSCDPNTGACVGSSGGCPGLGTDCMFDGMLCTDSNDICLTDGAGDSICSCTCFSDSDCGSGNSCADVGGGTSACVPGSSSGTDDCSTVTCPAGQVCSPATGTCIGGTDTSTSTDVAAPDTFIGGNDTTVGIDTIGRDVVAPSYDMGGTQQDTRPPSAAEPTPMEATGDCACDVRQGSGSPMSALGVLLGLVGVLVLRRRSRA